MEIALFIAALLLFSVGVIHSVLGERYILIRLFRRKDLPHLFGGPEFTIRTLRFAWHLTTLAWWGFACILVLLAKHSLTAQSVLAVIAMSCFLSSLITVLISRGKHFAWLVFFIVGCVCAWGVFWSAR
jgi:hypothetical protein